MKILCYSSCYGVVLKEKIRSPNIEKFDIITWYCLPKEVDYKTYLGYDILLCEYVSPKFGFKSSDNFIQNIKIYNPHIKCIIYPLLVMYIFPFHRNHFGFLRNKIIDQLLETHSKSEIIELYKKDMIMFNVKD